MKVKELIEHLQSLDPNLDVYIYNEKESSLFSVETVYETHDFGPSENGEAEWEDFITIFPSTDNKPRFPLTAEEVVHLQSLFKVLKIADKKDLIHLGLVFDTFIDYLLNRIKQWQDENSNS